MCRVEANQHRCVDFRVLQAEIQLPCHKWSLWGQKSHTREVKSCERQNSKGWSRVTCRLNCFSGMSKVNLICYTLFKLWPQSWGWLTDSPQEMPMNKTRFFPSHTCREQHAVVKMLSENTRHTLQDVPDLLQTEHAQSGVVFRSLLRGKQSSEDMIPEHVCVHMSG